jgi:predicted enzyme related to lactoylglutathione lyase
LIANCKQAFGASRLEEKDAKKKGKKLMKVGKSYTRLLVKDWKACFLFYKDVIEFDIAVENEEDGYAEFKAGDMRLSLFRRQEMAQLIHNSEKPAHAECQDTVALIFTVHDLEEEYQRLRHKGVQFTAAPMNNPYFGIKTAYLRDPDGTLIGLYEFLV